MSDNVLKPASSVLTGGRIDGNRIHRSGRLIPCQKVLFILLFAALFDTFQHGRATAMQHDISVASYIVKETGSPNVLMAKDIDRPVSPASLTKILTSIIAIESGRLDDEVVITKEATLVEPTKAGLREGDRIQLRDLVKAAMVSSSNDAAFSIAIYLGGSVEAFVSSMNSRARSLGMTHSHFTNPAGFDAGPWVGNQTTARDLMVLTEHAVRNPEFNAIARLDRASFRELATGRAFSLKTHNKMLELYPYTVGIKTGFTNHAGKCLIARAIKDRKDLLMVMLNARADRWTIASNMFDEGFGSSDRLPMPVATRQDSDMTRPLSARDVATNREKALEAIKLKVARQSRADLSTGIQAGSASRHGSKKLLAGAKPGMKRRLSANDRKLALKSPRNRSIDQKPALRTACKSAGGQRLALNMKKGVKARAAASVKAMKRGKVENRAALNLKKKGGEVTKVSKPKHRREALSFAGPVAPGMSTT